MGDDAAGHVSDGWFPLTAAGTWHVRVPDRSDLIAAAEGVAAGVGGAGGATIHATDSAGVELTREQLAGLAANSVLVIRAATSARELDTEQVEALIDAASLLRLFALWLLDALAAQPDAEEHEVMGFLERLVNLLDQATRARFATVVPAADGGFRLRWTDRDRALVAELSAELDSLLESDDPAVVRLFPPAYGTDEERSRDYDALARIELIESRRATLAVLNDALSRTVVNDDELGSLMRAVNDLRLVIGTRLDVSEDDDDPHIDGPDAAAWAAYRRLNRLLSDIVVALGG